MTIEEYERKIKEATDASVAAQAQKNAAEADALGSAVSTAVQTRGQELTGGTGEKPDWQSDRNASLQKKMREDEAKRAKDNLVANSRNTVGDAAVKTPEYTEAAAMSDLHAAHEAQYKSFTDMVDDYANEKKAREEEMRRQEQANTYSTMGSSFAELGAGLINMFSVGGLHATNQQYKNYTADWMKKADQDIQEHRKRREGMYDTLQRLKMQQEQVRTANKIEEMKLALSLKKEKEERERYERERTDRLAQQEWQRGITERQVNLQEKAQERSDKQAEASIAQGWARINQTAAELDMKAQEGGFVPDPDRPGKYKIDKDSEAYKTAVSSGKVRAGSGGGGNWYNVTIGGQPYSINMNKETREQAIKDGKEEMKADVLAMAGASSWAELDAGSGRRGRYQEYAAIIDALNGTGDPDEDNKVIADFYDRHRSKCERMGMHLYNVAVGARQGISTGAGGEITGTWEDEFKH